MRLNEHMNVAKWLISFLPLHNYHRHNLLPTTTPPLLVHREKEGWPFTLVAAASLAVHCRASVSKLIVAELADEGGLDKPGNDDGDGDVGGGAAGGLEEARSLYKGHVGDDGDKVD